MVDSHHIEKTKILHHSEIIGFLKKTDRSSVIEHFEDDLGHRAIVSVQHGQSTAELFTDLVSQADVFHGGIIVHTVGTRLYLPDVRLEMASCSIQ